MTPFEILKKTPRTNCGQCGHPTCLAFAAAVAKGGDDPGKCPFLSREGFVTASGKGAALEELPAQREVELIAHLQGKIATLDFAVLADPLGARLLPGREPALAFRYLGQEVVLAKNSLLLDNAPPADHRDQILLYNYAHSGGGTEPALDWIGLESLPNSISKVKTLATYCESRLALLFTQSPAERIRHACTALDGLEKKAEGASLAFLIPVLPRVPQHIFFWAEEPEDGFVAKAKVLFDRQVLSFLDLESLVFSAERLADRLSVLLAQP